MRLAPSLLCSLACTLAGAAAAQAPVPRDPVRVDAGTSGVTVAATAADGARATVAWFDTGTAAVLAAPSDDGGVTWDAPRRVDRDPGGAVKLVTRDSVRVVGDAVYVVWRDARAGVSTDDLRFNRSSDGGQTYEAVDVRLDDGAGGGNEVQDWRFAVQPDPTGDDLYVLFTAEVVGGNLLEELYLVASLDGGATWSAAVRVGGDDAAGVDVDQLALAVEGTTVHMAWEDDGASSTLDDVLYQRTTDAGATLLPAPVRLDASDTAGIGDAASVGDTGLTLAVEGALVLAVWPEERSDPIVEELRYATSVDGGLSWGVDARLGGYAAGVDDVDALDALVAGGRLFVTWADDRRGAGLDDVYVATSVDDGATFTEVRLSGNGGGVGPRLAGEADEVVAAYTEGAGAIDAAAAAWSVDGGATWGAALPLGDGAADVDAVDVAFARGAGNAVAVFLQQLGGANAVLSGGFALCRDGAAVPRNAGANPLSLAAGVPLLGSAWDATVDLSTTGHGFAAVLGYATPLQRTLAGGQVLLVNPADPSGELLDLAIAGGSPAAFRVDVPNLPGLCGATLSVQALHFGSVTPFALSNAVDLVVAAF